MRPKLQSITKHQFAQITLLLLLYTMLRGLPVRGCGPAGCMPVAGEHPVFCNSRQWALLFAGLPAPVLWPWYAVYCPRPYRTILYHVQAPPHASRD